MYSTCSQLQFVTTWANFCLMGWRHCPTTFYSFNICLLLLTLTLQNNCLQYYIGFSLNTKSGQIHYKYSDPIHQAQIHWIKWNWAVSTVVFIQGNCCCLSQVKLMFQTTYGEVVSLSSPGEEDRRRFFMDLLLVQAARAPPHRRHKGTMNSYKHTHRISYTRV